MIIRGMKRYYSKFSLVLLAAAIVLPFASVGVARAMETATEEQVGKVKNRCTQLESSLNQLERSDALLRNNIGNSYLTISQKLMVPMNQRIAANQLDGGKLVQISAEYKKTYDEEFYVNYKNYEISLNNTLKINCKNEPAELFESIAATREKRSELYDSSRKIITIAKEYNSEYKKFKTEVLKESR